MADSDLTIVILRNIQAELVSINERLDLTNERLDSSRDQLDSFRDQSMHQFARLDSRLTNVEEIAMRTATSLGVEAQGKPRQ